MHSESKNLSIVFALQIRCQDGERHHDYDLDERLVEFGTAVHDSDFGRAILYLESLEDSDDHQYEVDGMWQNLSDIGLQLMNLPVAARCLAGVGDYCKSWYLQETYKLAEEFAKENSYVFQNSSVARQKYYV